MSPTVLLLVYCVIIVCGSLLGGWLPSLIRLTHTRMQVMMSLVGGLMLGVALFHLLPHSIEYIALEEAVLWMVGGLLLMFFLVRAFHFHEHGVVETEPATEEAAGHSHGAADEAARKHDHDHACGHEHHHHGQHHHGHDHHGAARKHHLSWIGVALGLSLHTAIDGIALAADMAAGQSSGGVLLGLAGVGTFLAIVLHKPLDALSITSLMAAGGWSLGTRQLVNIGFSLMCPIGAFLFFLGFGAEGEVVGRALAAAAGVFLCISMGDLLPELQFHHHDRLKLSGSLLLGVAIAYGIHFVEPHHHHAASEGHDHSHHEHDHVGHDH